MRDIVATIQPEQDEIVRADLAEHGLRAGRPRHRQDGGRAAPGRVPAVRAPRAAAPAPGVLVVGPNRRFLRYIGDVLPALGEIDVAQATRRRPRRPRYRRRDRGPTGAGGAVKGDARMAEVLRRAVWAHVGRADRAAGGAARGVPAGGSAATCAEEIVDELLDRGVRYGAAGRCCRSGSPTRCWCGWRRPASPPTTGCRTRSRAASPVKAYVGAAVAGGRPGQAGAAAADRRGVPGRRGGRGSSTADEQQLLLWPSRPAAPGRARWSRADAVLIDEAADLVERTPSWATWCSTRRRTCPRCSCARSAAGARTGSVDRARRPGPGHHPVGDRDWAEALAHLGKPDAAGGGARPPASGCRREVIEYAARLLPRDRPAADARRTRSAGTGASSTSGRQPRGPPPRCRCAATQALAREGSVGVIVRRRRVPTVREGAGDGRAPLRPARRGRADLRHPGRPGAGHAGQGPGVRPRGAASSRPRSWPASPTR